MGSGAVGLEDYGVETRNGDFLGKAATLLRHNGETYLVIESGPPVARTLSAVPWEEVAEVDHRALTVRVTAPPSELRSAVELDPANAKETGEAEAVRVTDVPEQVAQTFAPDEPGPVDRPSYALALTFGSIGLFSALAIVLFASVTDSTWPLAFFAIPAVLLAISGAFAYRFFRRPSGSV
jgi:hypothetical protein